MKSVRKYFLAISDKFFRVDFEKNLKKLRKRDMDLLKGISKLMKRKKNSLTTPDLQRAFQTFAFQRRSRRGTSSRLPLLRLLNLCIFSKNPEKNPRPE